MESNRTAKTVAIRDTMSGQQTTENQSIVNRENAVPAVDLRDYFAAAALQGILSSTQTGHLQIIAKDAYGMADAMIRAREVRP